MSISVSRVPVPGGTHLLMAQIVDLVVDVVDLVLELVAEMQDVAILGSVAVVDTVKCTLIPTGRWSGGSPRNGCGWSTKGT
jgi:hypothetical protein